MKKLQHPFSRVQAFTTTQNLDWVNPGLDTMGSVSE